MGPRPDGRGKAQHAQTCATAAMSRQWGRGQTAAERRARKGTCGMPAQRQWGRGQTAAESGQAARAVRRRRRASMGPRPDGRGKTSTARESRTGPMGASMGPRPDGRGKWWARSNPHRTDASMGPRPDGRGKDKPALSGWIDEVASMGPRPDGRGKSMIPNTESSPSVASMGPRPDGRGKGVEPGA